MKEVSARAKKSQMWQFENWPRAFRFASIGVSWFLLKMLSK